MHEYFTKPINELLSNNRRSEKEEAQLQELISFQEIAQEMIKLQGTGLGFGSASWQEVEAAMAGFIPGTRTGNWSIVERARIYLGVTREQLGVTFEWCAWFVNKIYTEAGLKTLYGSAFNDNRCTFRMLYAIAVGRWVDAPYYDLAPGDVIFYQGDSSITSGHIEIVIGRDEEKVYTIGRRGDMVGIRVIDLDHTYIKGYEIFR